MEGEDQERKGIRPPPMMTKCRSEDGKRMNNNLRELGGRRDG